MTTRDAATTFLLWHARPASRAAVQFDATRANVPGLSGGDPEWVAAALRALGIRGSARSWDVLPARSHYFSDYRSPDEEWVDRWPEFWIVTVDVDGAAECPFSLHPVELGVLDSTYDGSRGGRSDESASIIGVGPPGALPPALEALDGSPGSIPLGDGRRLLRLDLSTRLPEELERLEAAVSALESSGWATDWRSAT